MTRSLTISFDERSKSQVATTRIDIPVRRKANAALSWWLLANSGGTSTTLKDAPAALFTDAVRGIPHGFFGTWTRRRSERGLLGSEGYRYNLLWPSLDPGVPRSRAYFRNLI